MPSPRTLQCAPCCFAFWEGPADTASCTNVSDYMYATKACRVHLLRWLSWLARETVNLEVPGSSPGRRGFSFCNLERHIVQHYTWTLQHRL